MIAAPKNASKNERFIEYRLAKQHQCQIDYMGELSKAKGLEELWKQRQPKFQQILKDWKACSEASIMSRFEYVYTKTATIKRLAG